MADIDNSSYNRELWSGYLLHNGLHEHSCPCGAVHRCGDSRCPDIGKPRLCAPCAVRGCSKQMSQ